MLPRTRLLGYAAGDAANNLTFSMVGSFLLLYYTDVAGVSAAAAGTLFLVVRVWDGLADLLAGRLVDRTHSRWGRFRPWLLFGSLPLLLLGVACFAIPPGLGDGATLVWAYVTYAAFGTAYSLVNIPYGSLAAVTTQDPVQRSRLTMARTMGAAAATFLLTVVVSPQIRASADIGTTMLVVTSGAVVVGMALYLVCFATARETVDRPVRETTLAASLRTVAVNRPLQILCLSSVAFLTAQLGLQTIGIYYARDVLGDAALYAVLVGAQNAMYLIAPSVAPALVRRIGKRAGYVLGCAVWVIGSAGLLFSPATPWWPAAVSFALLGTGLGVVTTLMWSLEADAVEYGQWRTGVRAEGATYAVYSFVRKIGQALGAAVVSWTIGVAGYVGGAPVQSADAVLGIRVAAGAVPGVFVLLALAVMLFHPLTEARHAEITAEIADRAARARSATTPGGPSPERTV